MEKGPQELPSFLKRIIMDSKHLFHDEEEKSLDGKIRSGPSPADLGEHDPIPEEAIYPVEMNAQEELGDKGDE